MMDSSNFIDLNNSYDVIYNKNTQFLRLANELNVQNKDGRDMLLYQAVLAFNIFFDNVNSFNDDGKPLISPIFVTVVGIVREVIESSMNLNESISTTFEGISLFIILQKIQLFIIFISLR